MIEIEVKEYVQLKILEDKIAELRRVYDEDAYISDSVLYRIFGWERKKKETCSASVSPAIVQDPVPEAPEQVPPFVKTVPVHPTAPIGDEMAAAIKRMFVEEGKKPKEIAEAFGVALSTVYSYLKKQGLGSTSSMTEISGPVPGAAR